MFRTAVLALYDPDGIIDGYIFELIDRMRIHVSCFIVVINGKIKNVYEQRLKTLVDDCIIMENSGINIGAYKDAILQFIQRDVYDNTDELILMNDTFYGPIYPIEEWIDTFDESIDFWGMTSQPEAEITLDNGGKSIRYEYIHSYFLAIRKKLLRSIQFTDYWKDINTINNRDDIQTFEISFTSYFNSLGYKSASLMNSRLLYRPRNDGNPYLIHTYELLKECGIPFIKKEGLCSLEQSYYRINDVICWIDNHSEYDVEMIRQNLGRLLNHFEGWNGICLFSALDQFCYVHDEIIILGDEDYKKVYEGYFSLRGWKYKSIFLSKYSVEDDFELIKNRISSPGNYGVVVAVGGEIKDRVVELLRDTVNVSHIFRYRLSLDYIGFPSFKKALIWGTGKLARYVVSTISAKSFFVCAMIDNNEKSWGSLWDGEIPVISPNSVSDYTFDLIVISAKKYIDIKEQCISLGIEPEKVVAFWEDPFENTIGNRSYEIQKYKNQIKAINSLYRLRNENIAYEYGNGDKPIVTSGKVLLKKMIDDKSSLSRFGDGEFEMILNSDRPWFQKVNSDLSKRLREVLISKKKEVNIGICNMFGNLDLIKEKDADEKRMYMKRRRKDIYSLLDLSRQYYDANVTRPYIEYKDKSNADVIFPLFKELFSNRKIILVEGKHAKNGIGNDLYNGAVSIGRIICPDKNAWDKYDDILEYIDKYVEKDCLICISLGPTATVMAYDLAMLGYQAIDIGQVDNEYDWYRMGAKKREKIPGKMVSEILEKMIEVEEFNEDYQAEILYDFSD